MRRLVIMSICLVAAACGSSNEGAEQSTGSSVIPAEAFGPDGLRVSCGRVELGSPADVQLPDTPLDEDAVLALEEARVGAGAEAGLFSAYEWSVAVQEEARLVLFGRAIDEALADEAQYADAELVLGDSGWLPTGWGQCHLVVDAPGFGNATVVLDPDIEPDPTSTQLHVLINERSCASGEPPIGREVVPVVVAEADRIVITVLVEPIGGFANCPSNPWHPITITLEEPLGDRQVLDGSTEPPVARPWPPTPDSINR